MGAPSTVRRSALSLTATAIAVAVAHRQAPRRSRWLEALMKSSQVVDQDKAIVVDAGDAIDVIELEQRGGRQRLSIPRFRWVEVEAEHRGGRGQAQIHQQEIDVASCQGVELVEPRFLGRE